jgi:WD40 repeat protein
MSDNMETDLLSVILMKDEKYVVNINNLIKIV